MMTEQVNLRLEEELLADLERVASEESLDRATVIRRLLKDSIKRWQLERAVRGYQRGELSIGRAAEEANLTQWELMDWLRRENVAYPMTARDVDDRLVEFDDVTTHPERTGFQIETEWMGSTVKTLADIRPAPGGLLLVGINPAPVSVAAGHYYQGALGKRLWARLERLGLLRHPVVPGAEDEAFARGGHGLTDLVKRPTATANEIGEQELRAGLERIRRCIAGWRPGLILFPFKRSAAALLGDPSITAGMGPEFEGVPTFLLSGPYAPAEEARRVDAALAHAIGSSDGRTSPDSHVVLKGVRPRARGQAKTTSSDRILRDARERFGHDAIDRYMSSDRQSDAARALGMSGRRLRDITRSRGVYVSRGGVWDEGEKLASLSAIVRASQTPRIRRE